MTEQLSYSEIFGFKLQTQRSLEHGILWYNQHVVFGAFWKEGIKDSTLRQYYNIVKRFCRGRLVHHRGQFCCYCCCFQNSVFWEILKSSLLLFVCSIQRWKSIENAQFPTEQKSDPYSTVIFIVYLNTLNFFFREHYVNFLKTFILPSVSEQSVTS